MSWKVYSDEKVSPVPEGKYFDAVVSFIPFKDNEIFRDEVAKKTGRNYVRTIAKIVECEDCETAVNELAGLNIFPPVEGEHPSKSARFQKAMKVILGLDADQDLEVDPAEAAEAMRSHSYRAVISGGQFVNVVELKERIDRAEPAKMPRIEPNGQTDDQADSNEDDDDIPF